MYKCLVYLVSLAGTMVKVLGYVQYTYGCPPGGRSQTCLPAWAVLSFARDQLIQKHEQARPFQMIAQKPPVPFVRQRFQSNKLG
jgi:hypothetical protein